MWNTVFVYLQILYLNRNIAKVKVDKKYSEAHKSLRITNFDLILPDKLIFCLGRNKSRCFILYLKSLKPKYQSTSRIQEALIKTIQGHRLDLIVSHTTFVIMSILFKICHSFYICK